MNIILFIITNVLLMISSYNIMQNFNKEKLNYKMKIIDFSMIYLFNILIITYILGFMIQKYNVYSITISSFVLFVFSYCILRNRKIDGFNANTINSLKNKAKQFIKNAFDKYNQLSKIYKFLVICVIVVMIFKFGMVLFLRVYDWDGLKYHLATLPNYIQDEHFSMNQTIIWSNTYPRNFEMFNMWILVFFRSSFLVKLPNFLIAFLGSIAGYELLKKLGISSNKCILGSILLLTMPVFTAQMNTVYIDTALTMLMIISVVNILYYLDNDDLLSLTSFAIAISIMIGIKFTAVVYAGIIGLIFAIALWRKKGTFGLFYRVLYVIPFLLIGSIWYICTWIYFDNPLFPFGYSIGGITLFEGISVSSNIVDTNAPAFFQGKPMIIQLILSWLGIGDSIVKVLVPKYDGRVGAFGVFWFINVLCSVKLFINSIKKKNYTYAVLVIAALLMLLITPANWWARYVGYLSILGIAGLLWVYENTNYKLHKIIKIIIILMLCQNCFASFITDGYYGYRVAKNYFNNDTTNYFYNQLTDDYEKWFFNHVGMKECTISSFRNDVGGFNMFGPNTQNRYYYFYSSEIYDCYDNDNFKKLSFISNQEDFDKALESTNSDYLCDNSGTVLKYIESYNKNHDYSYVLLAQEGSEVIYQKR